MIRDVGDDRPAQHTEGVMPADVVPRDVRRGVEAIAGIRRQVDAADERDLIVDDDDLFVVTCSGRSLASAANSILVPDVSA